MCGSQVSSNLYVCRDHRKDLPYRYHQFVEVTRSSFLIVRLWHHISYDIVSNISAQSFVDGRTTWLVILTRDHLMHDRCDAHLSLISRSPDSSSSLHLSGSPGVYPRYESKKETATTLESNLSSGVRTHIGVDGRTRPRRRSTRSASLPPRTTTTPSRGAQVLCP